MDPHSTKEKYQTFVSAQASQTLFSNAWFLFIVCIVGLGFYDYLNIGRTQWKTVPAILLILTGRLLSKYFNGPTWQKMAPFHFDAICAAFISSSIYLVIVCSYIKEFNLDSAPLQISLLGTGMFGFHLPRWVFLRNIAFGISAMLALYIFGSKELLVHTFGQVIIGTGCGSAMYFIVFDRLLKNKFTISMHLSEKSRTLRKVLESSKYPHQKTMIENGFNEDETLPVGQYNDALVIKLDVINSSKIRNPQYPQAFAKFCNIIESYLLMDYSLVSESPLLLTGKGFFIKRVGDAVIISVGYPFLPKSGMTIESCAADIIRKMEESFNGCMQEVGEESLKYCMGIVFGQICGEFSGKRMNYDLNGIAMNLAERYETLRKNFEKLGVGQPNGNFFIVQDKAVRFLNSLNDCTFEKVFCDVIRDDPGANHFWIVQKESSILNYLNSAS